MAFGKNEKDDFWDIDKLVPKKRATLFSYASADPTRDVEIPKGVKPTKEENGKPSAADSEKSRVENSSPRPESERSLGNTAGTHATERVISYVPSADGLIREVKIHRFVDKYDFYDNFRKSALIYYDYRPTARAEFAQFYSYMPQYSQLNPAQKAYYFFWRTEMQRGRFLKTDYSYVYLYVYEILNLPDKIPPEEGVKLLCRVWREYRRALPRLDLYFAIWVQDYCLVHRLDCPTAEIEDFIFDVISASTFKEFYISDVGRYGGSGTAALLAYLSDYDWRRGKYAAGDPELDAEERKKQATLYRTHMEGAMSLLFRDLWGECLATAKGGKAQTVKRDAFPNSLCTHSVKCKLEVEFYPIASATGLRTGVTAAVRYTENKIRALLGIRSRLAIKDLPNDYRRVIDYYFGVIEEGERKKKERASAPEYMRLYDAPRSEMSMQGADEIERASWHTTARLVEGMEENESVTATPAAKNGCDNPKADRDGSAHATAASHTEAPASAREASPTAHTEKATTAPAAMSTAPAAMSTAPAAETTHATHAAEASETPNLTADYPPDKADGCADTYGLSDGEIAYIAHLCFGGEYISAIPEDTIAERINEAFADGFGDVILEMTEDGYALIEDYREDITEWLYKITK